MAHLRIAAAVGTLILAGIAGQAHAQTAKKPTEAFTVRGEAQQNIGQSSKTIQWDAKKGRWGLKLDLGRDTQRDVEAGAYFRVTPSLRVGGAVGLESQQDVPVKKPGAEEAAPKVRLETAFKF